MGKRIIVAGAGHGGLAAANLLSKNGYDVTVYEMKNENELGYEWSDYFEVKSFSSAGFPLPKTGIVDKVPIAFYGPNIFSGAVRQNDQPGEYDMYMDRKDLYKHLIHHCRKNGVQFVFDCKVTGPIILGSRVVGIKTNCGDFYGDLIIDAAGVTSPIRFNLPAHISFTGGFRKYDLLYTYRGIFEKNPQDKLPENNYNVYLCDGNREGLRWCVTYDDYVDVLIGRFLPFKENEAEEIITSIREYNPQLGNNLLRGGKIYQIPITQTDAIIVADGYAAVGDCVGMTMPIMGSGISASIRAGAMLARAVLADEEDCFTRETLWQYETEYMKKLGFAFSSLELIKAVMTKLSKEDIAFLFDNKVFTSDDMTFGCDDISLLSLIGNMSVVDFIDRAKKASANPALLKKMSAVGVNFVKLKSITATFPSKYSENSVERWAERYNGFFNSTLDRIS